MQRLYSQSQWTASDSDHSGSPLDPCASPQYSIDYDQEHGYDGDDAEWDPVEQRARAPSTASHSSALKPIAQGPMRDAVINAADLSNQLLRREALRATSVPLKLTRVRLIECKNDISIYQYKRRPNPTLPTASKPSEAISTRIVGVAQVHAPITELIKIIGHKSALSFVLLNPGIADYTVIHTLTNDATQYVAVKSMTMSEQWQAPHISRKREFVVMESQQAFQTVDGRNGWVVSFHSMAFSSCPAPPLGAVRGSVYYTGIVALEASRGSETIDLFTAAEYNLKGQATNRVNRTAARERVQDTLVLLTGTIEQRAVTELSLLQSYDFNQIKKFVQVEVCRLCVARASSDAPQQSGPATHRCRKCCVSVCTECSSIWRRGKKEMRLCLDCWQGATIRF